MNSNVILSVFILNKKTTHSLPVYGNLYILLMLLTHCHYLLRFES